MVGTKKAGKQLGPSSQSPSLNTEDVLTEKSLIVLPVCVFLSDLRLKLLYRFLFFFFFRLFFIGTTCVGRTRGMIISDCKVFHEQYPGMLFYVEP